MKVKESYLRNLISEAILKEMNANNLPSKLEVQMNDGELKISFGKNGCGLSDEFLKIHEIIQKLSNENNVYLVKANIDAMDDVYDFIFHYDNKHFDD